LRERKEPSPTEEHFNKMPSEVPDEDLKKIEALEDANTTRTRQSNAFRRSSGHYGYERPGDMGDFKTMRCWRPKDVGLYTPEAEKKNSIKMINAPHTAPAASQKLASSKEFGEDLLSLSKPPLDLDQDSPLPPPRFRKRHTYTWQPSPLVTSPVLSPESTRRKRPSVSTLSPAIEKMLLDFSSRTDQIPPAFQTIQRKKGELSLSPTYPRKPRDLNAIELVSPRAKEVMAPNRLKKTTWPPVHKTASLAAKNSFKGQPGTVRNKRTSYEFQSQGIKSVLAPPLTSGHNGDGGEASAQRSSSLKRQASMVIRWAGPTYFTIEGRPLYDDDETIHQSVGPTLPLDTPLVDDRFESSNLESSPSQPTRQRSYERVSLDRPNIWVAPADISSPSVDGKWKVKRVWYASKRDQHEKEMTVNDAELIEKVKQLIGVPTPATPNIKEEECERYDPVATKWQVKTVYDTNGEIQGMKKTVMLNEDGLMKEFGAIVDEQVRMIIEDSEHSRSDLIAKWGFREGDSGHIIEDVSKWAEKRRLALNASQASTVATASSRGDREGSDDDEDSFAVEENKTAPPENARQSTSPREASSESPKTKNALSPTEYSIPSVDGDMSEKLNARWGYSEGGNRIFDDFENELLPMKKALFANAESTSESKHTMGAKWGYNLGGPDDDDDENELSPVAKMATLQIKGNGESTRDMAPPQEPEIPTSEGGDKKVLARNTDDRLEEESTTQGDGLLEKTAEKKKKKKKKKRKGEEENNSLFDLLCRDAWFDS
jgi:hypothetical protein